LVLDALPVVCLTIIARSSCVNKAQMAMEKSNNDKKIRDGFMSKLLPKTFGQHFNGIASCFLIKM